MTTLTLTKLAELMAAAPSPLSVKILATSGPMANEVLLQIGDVMRGGRSIQMPANYSHLIVAAINALPWLIAVAKAAEAVQLQTAKDAPFMDDPLEESLCLLDDALSQLNPKTQP